MIKFNNIQKQLIKTHKNSYKLIKARKKNIRNMRKKIYEWQSMTTTIDIMTQSSKFENYSEKKLRTHVATRIGGKIFFGYFNDIKYLTAIWLCCRVIGSCQSKSATELSQATRPRPPKFFVSQMYRLEIFNFFLSLLWDKTNPLCSHQSIVTHANTSAQCAALNFIFFCVS